MQTIVEPKKHIADLWGKQRIKEDQAYRLMKYVLRVDHEGKVLLHNVVTGRLVVLDQDEADVVDSLPKAYESVMEELVTEHYLVPEDYDEHQQVITLRTILLKLEDLKSETGIVSYTILPTTACNARCYYCFEQGCSTSTMTEETAKSVVDYIVSHCGKNKVFITWFGGEPTVASHRIDQICEGLLKNGIDFSSSMITNGYLFDDDMVRKAKSLWRVRYLQICVDGTEKSYNETKAYVNVTDNPYQRIMHNIEMLLSVHINVALRMNFDLDNYKEFESLCDEVLQRFGPNEYLLVASHPVIGAYKNAKGLIHHGSDSWFADKVMEFNALARHKNLLHGEKPLPSMNIRVCGACKDYCNVIIPDGSIVECPEQFSTDQIVGNVNTGITNLNLVSKWKIIADYKMCENCKLFPCCARLANCSNKTYCHIWKSFLDQYQSTIKKYYLAHLKEEN